MSHRAFTIILFTIYMTLASAFLIYEGKWVAPDKLVLFLLLGCLLIGRGRQFILDWLPFVFILLSYDFLRGFADNLGSRVHFQEMINVDKFLFGSVPTVALQQRWFRPDSLQWYDYYFTLIYFLHFALPLGFAFLLWLTKRHQFRQFITGILVLSYGALATYLFYPAAPPWLASEQGYLPPIEKVLFTTTAFFSSALDVPTIYNQFNPNPIAAVPSLHAAYPFLIFLFAWKFFRWKSFWFLPYVLSVWITLVYFGEHYVIDIILGIFYSFFAYTASVQVLHTSRFHRLVQSKLNPSAQRLRNLKNWRPLKTPISD